MYKRTALYKICIVMLQNGINFVTMLQTAAEENVFKEN
jgi:hypothetical protein